jgi:hypothetical protein
MAGNLKNGGNFKKRREIRKIAGNLKKGLEPNFQSPKLMFGVVKTSAPPVPSATPQWVNGDENVL